MKKLLALTLACLMLAMSLVACGTNNDNADDTTTTAGNNDATTTPADTTTAVPEDTTTAAPELAYDSALAVLNTIWATYADSEKFAVAGGDEANMSMEGPGKYGIADAEVLDAMLGFPQAEIAKIDDAASLMFMMNQNSFTGAAYHFTSADNATSAVEAIKNNILARQWMCGFPDKVVIISLPGNYLISIFGLSEGFVDPFIAKTLAAIDGAQVVVEQNIE